MELLFNPSPDHPIILYRLIMPAMATCASVVVFGAGRVEVTQSRRLVGQLAPDEMRRLHATVLRSGLAAFDGVRLARERQQFRAAREATIGVHPLPCSDLGRSEIQLRLIRKNGSDAAVTTVDAVLCAVHDESAAFPEWQTVARYAEADRHLRGLLIHPSLVPLPGLSDSTTEFRSC